MQPDALLMSIGIVIVIDIVIGIEFPNFPRRKNLSRVGIQLPHISSLFCAVFCPLLGD
jgi:hypothetical protein